LAPGNHILTILTKGVDGAMQTITQSFTVYAAGSQFTEPSVSPIISVAPTATPTIPVTPPAPASPTPTIVIVSPTATPTATITPNLTLTMAAQLSEIPTLNPDQLTATAMATGATVAPSGTYTLIFVSALAILSTVTGFIIFFL